MKEDLQDILDLLSCPDDQQSLRRTQTALCCNGCGRHFPVYEDNFVELLPSGAAPLPLSINEEYRKCYLALFSQKVEDNKTAIAWGAEESATEPWVRKRRRQVLAVFPLATTDIESTRSTLCDIAAGAGYYTFAYAEHFRRILHCDLSIENLNYCRRRAYERSIKNIFFLRIDYFRMPFRHSIDRILCLDTIIRGQGHDGLLLKSITEGLNRGGKAIVDFHNWWHNPLRRLGLLKDTFVSNTSYSRRSAESLLAATGIQEFEYTPFHQEFPSGRVGSMCARLIPPTRLIYSFDRQN